MKFWESLMLVGGISMAALAIDDIIIWSLWDATDITQTGHRSRNHEGVAILLAMISLAATTIVGMKSKHVLLALATLLLTCGGSFLLGHYVLHKW